MDLYTKYYNVLEYCINQPIDGKRPIFMTNGFVKEMELYRNMYGYDGACWESNIIDQINLNKYGWFDFSKNLIDIGAGLGEYPLFTNFKHAYAFEPLKLNQCLIYANMASLDKVNDIDVIPYAISDIAGTRGFNGWSEDDKQTGKNEMEFRTLDSFNIDNVGLIKLDIEGFEYHAIRSGIGTIIRSNYPPMLIEIWDDNNIYGWFHDQDMDEFYYKKKRSLLKLLDDLGYVKIEDPGLGDWETFFYIHKDQLNGYENPQQ